jgi:hypothetical protein
VLPLRLSLRPSSRATTVRRRVLLRAAGAGCSLFGLAGFPVELLSREHGCPLKKRRPDGKSGRASLVIDEIANQSFDVGALEYEDHGLIGEKDAVLVEAGQSEPVGGTLGDDLGCTLA